MRRPPVGAPSGAPRREQPEGRSSRAASAGSRRRGALPRAGPDWRRTLETLMANLPGMAYRCLNDPQWTVQFASDGCMPLTGYAPADLIGNRRLCYAELIHPDDRERVWDEVQAAVGRREPFRLVYRIRTADGAEKWVWEQGCGVHSEDGTLEGLEGFITDITERENAKRDAQTALQLHRDTLAAMSSCFVLLDSRSRVLMVNASFLRDTERREEDVIGMPAEQVLPAALTAEPNVAAALKAAAEADTGAVLRNVCVPSPQGPDRYLEVHVSPADSGDGVRSERRVLLVYRDVTDSRMLEEQLRQAATLESVGALAGGVAHDFNNLLTGIMGHCQLALDALPPASDEHRSLRGVLRLGERAAELTRHLLAFSRRLFLEERVANVNDLVGQIAARVLRRMVGTSVALSLRLAAGAGDVRVDPQRLEQVLMNLAVNACEAMPDGGLLTLQTANARLDERYVERHPGAATGEHVLIAVTDTGHGMDEEVSRRLFEPFFTTKPPGAGVGMGLAAVHGIVSQHGGHVAVYTAPGFGASFHVYLPRADEGDGDLPVRAVDAGVVLLVEAKAPRPMFDQALTDLGCAVAHPTSARRAAQAAAEGRCGVLVADLPSWRRLQQASDAPFGLPVVLLDLAGAAQAEEAAEADHVAASVLRWPFTPLDLMKAVLAAAQDGRAQTSEPG